MFKITPVNEKAKQKELCLLVGAEFRDDAFCYQMYDIDSGEIMGISQFEIGSDGYIYDIKEAPHHDDFEAMFILARQTMNFIDSCGAHICYADQNCGDKRLIIAVGFKEIGGKYFCNLSGMFDGHCECK